MRLNRVRKISVRVDKGSLFSRFTVNGQGYTHYYGSSDLTLCELLAKQIELDIRNGVFDASLVSYSADKSKSAKRVGSFMDMWLEWNIRLNLSDRTSTTHYAPIAARIPTSTKITDLSWLELAAENWGADTWNARIATIKRFGNWLVEEGYLPINPYKGLKNKKSERKEYIPFTWEELVKIHNKISERNKLIADFYLFLALTGCRPAEVIGLLWKDVNRVKKVITISSVLARDEKGGSNPGARVRKETKTNTVRVIPICDKVASILVERWKEPKGLNPGDWLVFTNSLGNPVDDRNALNRYWKPALEALGIPYRVPYAARHTAISQLLHQGVPAIQVAKQMGTSLEMIDRHYGHLMSGPMPHVDYEGELGG
jgi:integrase